MNGNIGFLPLRNAQAVDQKLVPELSLADFRRTLVAALTSGGDVAALFGNDAANSLVLYAVLADRTRALLHVGKTRLDNDCFPSLTPECPQVHLFEREIAEQWGVIPEGHPWLKPVRFHRPYRTKNLADPASPVIGVTDYYRVEGEEIHEVAVGPVHAGIIEPGHFRFQCHGEQVAHLEISLGYQHRGIEKSLRGGPSKRTIHVMETVAGDTTIGHSTAYCQAVEALAGCQIPMQAEVLRGVTLELERLANHAGDLGALAGDVGFLPTASYCGRIRGDFLNLTALLCGSRFGRGMLRPGGVGFDADSPRVSQCLERLESAQRDVAESANLLWDSPSVMARFESTGAVDPEIGESLGLVGPAARACGIARDIRGDYPSGIFRFAHIPMSTWMTGDVFARAYVRWLEIQRSVAFIRSQLSFLPGGATRTECGRLQSEKLVVSLVEGWRGEICHVALTDDQGRLACYKIVDPSFHNWMGLALALRDQQISDFPLCNKSFNLSYCGHDL